MISGERVRLAREYRGLTQTELARQIGVTQPYIAQVEGGLRQLSDAALEAIALKTGFPLAFFRQGSPPDFALGSLLFRSQAAVTSRERSRVFRYGQLAYEMVERVLAPGLTRPEVRLPKLTGRVSTQEAAGLTRDALRLPLGQPVPHLIDAAERAGVLVIMLPTPIEKGDAFSIWAGVRAETPVIAVGDGKPGDRVRLTIAHELGELVLNSSARGRLDEMEREAYRFGAELLMPEEAMREELVPPVTLTALAELKPRWKVSIQALARRAYDLGIITHRQYTYLFEQLSASGWRLHEPISIPVERARGLRKMVEVRYGKPPDYARLASDARLTVPFVRKLIEAQAEEPSKPVQVSASSKVIPLRRKAH